MQPKAYIPSALLRPFIRSYRIIESQDELTNRVLPNTSFAIAFRLRGQISYIGDAGKADLPRATLSGLRKSVRLINYAPQSQSLIVLFTETGVSAFFKQPVHELFEQTAALDNFFPRAEISILEERLAATPDPVIRIAIVEQFLLSKLIHQKPDPLVTAAIAQIYAGRGNRRISELAHSLYISQDAFEKRFRKVTGTTPKQFSSIVKLQAIIHQPSASSSFLDMAHSNGYFDQAHFNKDFKLFTGLTPTDFFRSGSFW
jgi:AraC-like DNA-binding protein